MVEGNQVFNNVETNTRAGDMVELVGLTHKNHIFILENEQNLHTHRGIIYHNDLIDKPWGSQVFSHNGSPFFLLQPSLENILKNLPRSTQILYPKDIGFILIKMGIGPGIRLIEAGTGSGALTSALAYFIGNRGQIFSYEMRTQMQANAKKNLSRFNLLDRVTLKTKDIADGFDEKNVDAIFLDLPNPFDYMEQVRESLKSGGQFGCILPSANQVCKLLSVLKMHDFAFVDVVEILLRHYKDDPERFRPVDRMVAHTGFLVFARPVIIKHN
jgi:tRNA (adenine57-N1/adenine58-N1)-methyltransferase catalytic subunit